MATDVVLGAIEAEQISAAPDHPYLKALQRLQNEESAACLLNAVNSPYATFAASAARYVLAQLNPELIHEAGLYLQKTVTASAPWHP